MKKAQLLAAAMLTAAPAIAQHAHQKGPNGGALAILAWRLIPKSSPPLEWPVWRPLIVCSQHSLEVFGAGMFLAFKVFFAIDPILESFVFQLLVSVVGIATMIGIAYCRRRTKTRSAERIKGVVA